MLWSSRQPHRQTCHEGIAYSMDTVRLWTINEHCKIMSWIITYFWKKVRRSCRDALTKYGESLDNTLEIDEEDTTEYALFDVHLHDVSKPLLGNSTWIVDSMAEMKKGGSDLRVEKKFDIGSGECQSSTKKIESPYQDLGEGQLYSSVLAGPKCRSELV